MSKFRFQDLIIWQNSIEITDELIDISDELEKIKYFRFADQLRGSVLSISNNIAEGSGSKSKIEFKQFLNYARRSIFETANILIVIERRGIISSAKNELLLEKLDILSRQIFKFNQSL